MLSLRRLLLTPAQGASSRAGAKEAEQQRPSLRPLSTSCGGGVAAHAHAHHLDVAAAAADCPTFSSSSSEAAHAPHPRPRARTPLRFFSPRRWLARRAAQKMTIARPAPGSEQARYQAGVRARTRAAVVQDVVWAEELLRVGFAGPSALLGLGGVGLRADGVEERGVDVMGRRVVRSRSAVRRDFGVSFRAGLGVIVEEEEEEDGEEELETRSGSAVQGGGAVPVVSGGLMADAVVADARLSSGASAVGAEVAGPDKSVVRKDSGVDLAGLAAEVEVDFVALLEMDTIVVVD